jgi:hypothetical protein
MGECRGHVREDRWTEHVTATRTNGRGMIRCLKKKFLPEKTNTTVKDTANIVGSRFATVRSKTHFYDPCPVGPSTPDVCCITVATQASFLYLVRLLALFQSACVSSFSILVQFLQVDCDFSTHDVHQKDRKEAKIRTFDVFWTKAWAFFNRIKSDLIDIFFNYLCNFLYNQFVKLKLYVIM